MKFPAGLAGVLLLGLVGGATGATPLIMEGSSWRYRDDAGDPPDQWTGIN